MTCFHACDLINLVERTNGLTGKHQKILVQEGQTIRYLTLPGEIVRDISLHGSTQVIVTAQVLLGLQLSEGHKCLCLLTGAGDKAADCSLTRTWLNSLSATISCQNNPSHFDTCDHHAPDVGSTELFQDRLCISLQSILHYQ